MLCNALAFLRGCIATLLITLNLLLSAICIMITALIAKALPGKAGYYAMKVPLELANYWMLGNKLILKFSTFGKWDIQGTNNLNKKGWYILIANHESWIDIPVLGSIFTGKVPLLKFFMKKELLWQLPIAGLDCYLLGYPILARHSRTEIRKNPELKGKDIEATRQACHKFKEHPTTFMNFVEGTRFSKEKHQRQNSPFRHLLKPKAAGVAVVLTEMADKLDGIINTTIHYDAKDNSLWRFLCGKINKIYIRYEIIPITPELIGNYYDDRVYRKNFQQWLNNLWEQKDATIDAFKGAV